MMATQGQESAGSLGDLMLGEIGACAEDRAIRDFFTSLS